MSKKPEKDDWLIWWFIGSAFVAFIYSAIEGSLGISVAMLLLVLGLITWELLRNN